MKLYRKKVNLTRQKNLQSFTKIKLETKLVGHRTSTRIFNIKKNIMI